MHASRLLSSACGVLLVLSVRAETPPLPVADRDAILRHAVDTSESIWQRANELPGNLSSRDLYLYALVLCEAGEKLDRLSRLFEVGARMQDRDEQSRGFGNFRWSWEDGSVLDYNAVEFCMQSAALIGLRHADTLPPEQKQVLWETFDFAAQGSLRHRVPASYTNIALMNAQSLILLGEVLTKPEIADEGYRRLESVCIYTWENGIHEYDSPTYYGVDLDCLVLIERFCKRESGKEQARALLELFWTDLAANWWDGNQRLAGARSRDYDYLRGQGYLDTWMWAVGWLSGDIRGGKSLILPALADWFPDAALRERYGPKYPRLIQQKWGVGGTHTRTHLLLENVTLSSAGANYGPMDLPLTVDLPGDREMPRCYFIPDARRDPYGKKKIPAGPHEKTLHLKPFWCATQRGADALGLVVYRPHDFPETPATLESHFVIPREIDGLWLGDSRVALMRGVPGLFPLEPGQPLFVRKGPAAIAIRVPWALGLDGDAAQVALVDDGNPHGVVRLTVAHHSFWGIETQESNATACFWIRVADGMADDATFARWRADFAKAESRVRTDDMIELSVQGGDGTLSLASAPPFLGFYRIEPQHASFVLGVDGSDVGREILSRLACVKAYKARPEAPAADVIAVDGDTTWEAEAGILSGEMAVGEHDEAFGTRYVWTPGEVDARGGKFGSVAWRLKIKEAGIYYLSGRVLTPSQQDDSFFVRMLNGQSEFVSQAAWHTGSYEEWTWSAVSIEKSQAPARFYLPEGEITIEFSTREDAAAIDQLFITTDPNRKPN